MQYQASFINRKGDTISLAISIPSLPDGTAHLDDGSAGVYLAADDTITIESSVSDTFAHILSSTAAISIETTDALTDFFRPSVFDAPVSISCNDTCVFAGYLTPQSYDQDYISSLDDFQLNCVDALSALQYAKYKNVGAAGVDYAKVKLNARQLSFLDIIKEVVRTVGGAVGSTPRIFYDGSKAIDGAEANRYSIFSQISVNELLFLGDEEDDVWAQDKVLEEILRYLDLHIVMKGKDFYIFDWQTARSAQSVEWHDILGSAVITENFSAEALTTQNAEDASTQISVGECYNKLLLTCDLQEMENIIESPLDDDSLSDGFPGGRQHYMTEYSAEGEGRSAFDAFKEMVKQGTSSWGAATVTEWFVKVMKATNWKFSSSRGDLYSRFLTGRNQQFLPNCLSDNIGAAILSLGKVEKTNTKQDDSLVNSISMEEQLVISTGKFCREAQVSEEEFLDAIGNDIKNNIPVAEYTGNIAGGVFSPSDDNVTNYICIDGKMILNPHMPMTAKYSLLYDHEWRGAGFPGGSGLTPDDEGKIDPWHKTVYSRKNGEGNRYYTRKYFRADTPRSEDVYDPKAAYTNPLQIEVESYGFCPFTDTGEKLLKFNYSAVGDSSDTVSKVGVLCCMLVIGDKCVVEKTPDNDLGTGVPYTGKGYPEDFVWMPYKELADCESEDEYYQQSFSIGFNPKVGDCLVGVKYDMQLNHSYQLGIDDDGIAIPIRKSDKVSGQVRFSILGPYNAVWNDVTRRHPTLFRHTKWTENTVSILRKVASIIITDLSVTVCSDSGLTNTDGNKDLVYMSDTDEAFVNKKDDIDFKITSALTSAEAAALGVKNAMSISTPLDIAQGSGLLSIYDNYRNDRAKPEQLYVDSYYTEYHLPRIILKQNVRDPGCKVSPFSRFRHEALAKDFYPFSLSRNLQDGSASLEMKECF